MKLTQRCLLGLLLLTFASCSGNKKNEVITQKARVIIEAKSNSDISGMVTFTENAGVIKMQATISNASQGNHAIHIHAIGDCSADDGTSAGGHWNPTNENHGKWGDTPFHRGDIGNVVIQTDGKGSFERETDLWCIGCDDNEKNILGKAIIIHQGPDDFSSQPAGAAGPRIGCGEIEKIE